MFYPDPDEPRAELQWLEDGIHDIVIAALSIVVTLVFVFVSFISGKDIIPRR